ncbi:hypothetical protein [Sulfitobacter sp. JB4-11]|uniref:hypothetical protein n=1 Tax=Sulfitobacter rhodophyticola TaxID=3238304 RepID=UPI0035117505
MIPRLARNTAVATAVFFVVILIFRGDGVGSVAIWSAVFASLVFAMAYAALQVALIMFKGDRE